MTETIHIICGPTNETRQRCVYPVTEVARRLGVSRRHVYRLAKTKGFDIESVQGISCLDAEVVDAYEAQRSAVAS